MAACKPGRPIKYIPAAGKDRLLFFCASALRLVRNGRKIRNAALAKNDDILLKRFQKSGKLITFLDRKVRKNREVIFNMHKNKQQKL